MRSVPPRTAPIIAPTGGLFAVVLLVEREVDFDVPVLDIDIVAGGRSTSELHQIFNFQVGQRKTGNSRVYGVVEVQLPSRFYLHH
jgi:hypothetical protein